jgi:hypothetical protein
MALMNSMFRKLLEQFKNQGARTTTNTNINSSPRQVSINAPRTAKFSDSSKTGSSVFMPLQKGGSVVAKGNKLARSRPTKLY